MAWGPKWEAWRRINDLSLCGRTRWAQSPLLKSSQATRAPVRAVERRVFFLDRSHWQKATYIEVGRRHSWWVHVDRELFMRHEIYVHGGIHQQHWIQPQKRPQDMIEIIPTGRPYPRMVLLATYLCSLSPPLLALLLPRPELVSSSLPRPPLRPGFLKNPMTAGVLFQVWPAVAACQLQESGAACSVTMGCSSTLHCYSLVRKHRLHACNSRRR